MQLTQLQEQALGLFQKKDFASVVSLLRNQPVDFPKKQIPVVQASPDASRVGKFGCRVSPTHCAVQECNYWIVFTVNIDGQVTLNLHGNIPQSVDWTDGTQQYQWIFHERLSQREADEFVITHVYQMNPDEDCFAQYMDWAEAQNAIIEREQKSRYAPTDDDIFAVDFKD